MSKKYLYEFEYLNSPVQRLTEGEDFQVETYTWYGVDKIEDVENYINILDTRSNNFPNWLANRSISKLFVTKYTYDTEAETITETSRNLYSNMSSDATSVSLRISAMPEDQLEDAQKLIADGIIQLYEIILANESVIRLKQDNSVTWNGENWFGIPILFEGYSSAQGNSYSRPTLSIANPDVVNNTDDKVYSTYSSLTQPQEGYPYGLLDRAIVNRYLVLYDDLVNDRPIYQKKTWIIWFIKSVNKNVIQVELRNPMDGVNFDVPARMYIPPEFPFVTLG